MVWKMGKVIEKNGHGKVMKFCFHKKVMEKLWNFFSEHTLHISLFWVLSHMIKSVMLVNHAIEAVILMKCCSVYLFKWII